MKKKIEKKPAMEPLKLLVYSVRGRGWLFIMIEALVPFISFRKASLMTFWPTKMELGIEEL